MARRRAATAGDERRQVRLVASASAAARIAAVQAFVAAVPADAELVVVAPSWEAADEIGRAASIERGARFGLVRLTFGHLASRLAAPGLAADGRVAGTSLLLDAVAARAAHRLHARDALPYFAPVAGRPGFPRAVARTLAELRLHGVEPDRLRAVPHVGGDLAALACALEEELAAAGLADRAQVLAAATAAAAAVPSPPLVGVPLVLLDLAVATPAEGALLAALARAAPAVLATTPAGDARAAGVLARALGIEAETLADDAGATSLGALRTHVFASSAPASGDLDDSVQVCSWPGEGRECVEIARAVLQHAATGVPFDRMAVLLHAARDYTAHLEEAFGRAGIPVFFAAGTKQPDPSGRAFLALLACAAEGLSARRFAEYLSLAQVPDPAVQAARAADPVRTWTAPDDDAWVPPLVPPAEPAASEALPDDPAAVGVVEGTLRAPWRWEQILVDAAVIGGRARWARRLAGLARELALQRAALAPEDEGRIRFADQQLADLAHLEAYALPLVERLDALPVEATWEAWIAALRGLADAALRDPTAVLAALAELAPMAPVGPVELDEVQLVLGERLRTLAMPPPRRRYGAVFVAPAEAARGVAFDVVFVPGLAERLFPRKIVEDPILRDAGREALGSEGLTVQATRVAHERLALRLAIGAARTRVVLSYPRLDTEQGRPRVPSFYLLEALRAGEGRLPDFDELATRARARGVARLGWPAPERPADAIDDAEYDLALLRPLLDADPADTVGTAHYLLGANPHLARALRVRARRWLRRWTPADGLVDPDALGREALARHQLGARSYSPTALQNFAACPYRFFLQAIHRLRPREEPEAIEAMDPLTRGALFHDVQFGVLTALREAGALPVRPASLAAALAAVDDVLDDVAGRYAEELAPAIPRVWEDGIHGVRADLREWLRREAESDGAWVPHRFELSFGLAERERTHADPASITAPVATVGALALRGSIDLVERHTTGVLRATDHKTGKVRAAPGVVVGGGEILQPVLYALALERLVAEPVAAGRLYYCTATGGYEERVVPLDGVARAAAGEVVAIVDRALTTGFLPAAPVPRGCLYCDYRSVCGPYEETRVRRKPVARLGDLAHLRGLP